MTNFGKPGDAGELPDDAEQQPTREQVADALEARKSGAAKERFQADRKASVQRGNRKR